jgi:hypothetical protein
MNLCDSICECCSEIELVLVNGVVKLNLFLVELNLLELELELELAADANFCWTFFIFKDFSPGCYITN